ncbi:hypothetical protein Tco_0375289 [Tanacetum coccineum]
MRMEALQAREDLMKSIQNFLKKFNRISFRETPKVLMQAWDKFFEVKHAQSEEVQELLNKLLQDLQSINEELAEYINTPSWNLPTSSYDDDDDEYSFATQEYLMTCSTAITPDSPKTDSLIMVDKHLDTIPETESDEFIKSSVENLVQNPSESEDKCEYDVPDYDDSQTTRCQRFNPRLLLSISTSSDEEYDLYVSSPSGDRKKIYDPRICIEVESTRFLATLSPVIDTLLLFSSENEVKVFNHGVLASKEKSPPSSSHRGFNGFKFVHQKKPDVGSMEKKTLPYLIAPDFEASRARGFVLRSLELQSSASLWESNILILSTNSIVTILIVILCRFGKPRVFGTDGPVEFPDTQSYGGVKMPDNLAARVGCERVNSRYWEERHLAKSSTFVWNGEA